MWGSGGDERGPQAANIESGGGGLWEGVPKRLKLSIVEGGCILEGLVINLGGESSVIWGEERGGLAHSFAPFADLGLSWAWVLYSDLENNFKSSNIRQMYNRAFTDESSQ